MDNETIKQTERDERSPDATQAGAGEVAKRESAPHPLEERVRELEEKLRKSEARAEEEKERYLRVTAEVDAKRKRLADDAANKVANFKLEMVQGFLRVVDNLERALESVPDTETRSSLREGIEITLKEFYRLLDSHGIQQIEPVGQPFDPHAHEAIAVRCDANKAENEVIEMHRRGYRLGEHLLRPAQVVVNQAGARDLEDQTISMKKPVNQKTDMKGQTK